VVAVFAGLGIVAHSYPKIAWCRDTDLTLIDGSFEQVFRLKQKINPITVNEKFITSNLYYKIGFQQ
jgi:hypothetical protein